MRVQPRILPMLEPALPTGWESEIVLTQTSGTHFYIHRDIRYLGADPRKGAVTNLGNGTARHIFVGCRFLTNSHVLRTHAAAGFEFYNCVAQGLNPNVDGQPIGCLIEGAVNWLIVENCNIAELGGIRLVGSDVAYNRVRYNRFKNIVGALSNGSRQPGWAGFREESKDLQPQFVKWMSMWQANGITCGNEGGRTGTAGASRSEISWNEVYNFPGESRCADHISLFGSGGVADGNLWIHHNYLHGAFTINYAKVPCVGRGILMENPGAKGRYIDVEDNWIVAIPGAINLYRGHDYVNIRRNKAWYSRRANGIWLPTYNVPYNADAANTGSHQKWEGNSYHWYSQSFDAMTTPFVQNFGNAGNSKGSDWIEIGSDCTESDEASQLSLWRQAAAAEGNNIGTTLQI